MEGSTFLLSNQKEQSRGTPLFCDFYDTHAKAYCKRLRAVCEHTKEPKYPPDSICGFPLVENEEARLQRSLAQRAGILGMLLHRTVEDTGHSDEDDDAEEADGGR
ncbi:unnamed protein product [Dibothriocephalus latus]|uniref:CpG binding protein C-terminal domain-containing protein n=1 Tax=Dibothriocephalus latus TaxID=60516 RepID=A0A3P7PS60_DIBLA|nr:unnamed protein product [Dibothriocephalus latus]